MTLRLLNYCLLALALLTPRAGFAIGTTLSDQPLPLSLQDCMDYAMKHSDTMQNARMSILKQSAVNNQIRAAALPHINGSGQFSDYVHAQEMLVPKSFFTQNPSDANEYAPVQFSPSLSANIGVSANQALFDGSVLVALKARRAAMEAVRDAATLSEENMRYNIQKAYYAVVIGEQQFRTLSASLQTARSMMHDVVVLYKTGFAEKIDINRSEVQVTNLETDSIRTAAMLETGRQALKYTIGMDIRQPIILTDTSISENIQDAAALLAEQLDLSKRTEMSLGKTMVRLLEHNLKRYQLSALPTLNAFGNMGYNYGSNTFNDLTRFRQNYLYSAVVGLQLNIPIFNGLARDNQVREAKIDLEMAKNRLDLLKQSLEFQMAQARTSLRNALLSAEKQRRNLDLAAEVVDLAGKKFKAGVGSSLELNQAQTELLMAQNNFYSTMLDVVNAQSDVQKALGRFNP
ncbi:MAG: TolC family protein [Bacteroidetes bacterium]|nr:TolC family protein [Bacteroidota bacterium]MBS1629308.1 TolC family protein [Bacteroidota bacterium]